MDRADPARLCLVGSAQSPPISETSCGRIIEIGPVAPQVRTVVLSCSLEQMRMRGGDAHALRLPERPIMMLQLRTDPKTTSLPIRRCELAHIGDDIHHEHRFDCHRHCRVPSPCALPCGDGAHRHVFECLVERLEGWRCRIGSTSLSV